MTIGELKAAIKKLPDYMTVEVLDSASCGWVPADEMLCVVADIRCSDLENGE